MRFERIDDVCFGLTIAFAFHKYLRRFSICRQYAQVLEAIRTGPVWGGHGLSETYATPGCCQGLQIMPMWALSEQFSIKGRALTRAGIGSPESK